MLYDLMWQNYDITQALSSNKLKSVKIFKTFPECFDFPRNFPGFSQFFLCIFQLFQNFPGFPSRCFQPCMPYLFYIFGSSNHLKINSMIKTVCSFVTYYTLMLTFYAPQKFRTVWKPLKIMERVSSICQCCYSSIPYKNIRKPEVFWRF